MSSVNEQVASENRSFQAKTALDIVATLIPRAVQNIRSIEIRLTDFYRSRHSELLAMTGGIEIAEFRAADFSQNGRGHGHAMELIRLARIAVQEIEKLIADGGDGQGPVGPISIKGGERTESWAPMPDHEPAPEPAPEGWAYASTQAAELRKLVEEMSELLAKPNHPRKALETVLERLSHDLGGEADTAASVVHDWANEWRERKHGEGRE